MDAVPITCVFQFFFFFYQCLSIYICFFFFLLSSLAGKIVRLLYVPENTSYLFIFSHALQFTGHAMVAKRLYIYSER